MPVETNRDRGELARPAYEAFRKATRFGPEDENPREVIGDLIADLLHLGDTFGLDADDLLADAETHYFAEVDDEEFERQLEEEEADAAETL